jgi:1-deoxy-D-xylulose-5-phosphate reductoisomerase
VAVEAFLTRRISFPAIYKIVEQTVSKLPNRQPRTIDDILELDKESRSLARELIARDTQAAAVVAAPELATSKTAPPAARA